MPRSSRFSFDAPLSELDPEISGLIDSEGARQEGKIILIASESLCPKPVAAALASPYSAIYAEGYPSTRMCHWERDRVSDHDRHLAFNRRYADRRYYKGCEYTNFIEVLAQKRAAELFAANGLRADDLFVNVQTLSGSGANNAIYTAFLEPGDTIMGMALPHGGHLSHGSELNRSGKFYRVFSYTLDPRTGRLDYDAIKDQVREHRPKILIAGASAYPWGIDWAALREAADQVPGCLLLGDISHPSGLVAAGLFPSPVGHADVVSLTTHKTLCGPRGAIIITTDRERAAAIDAAVFPGEQGGPHINQIAAKAVAFGIAQKPEFKELMSQVRRNADAMAAALARKGAVIPGGGTESHLFLVDLKGTRKRSGVPLYGDIAANVLDLCGITLNKNTIPGDLSAAHPTGVRIGTTLVSQQGYDEADMEVLADLIYKIIDGAETFTVITGGGVRGRARLDLDLMEEVRAGIAALTKNLPPDTLTPAPMAEEVRTHDPVGIEVRGERSGPFLQSVCTAEVLSLGAEESVYTTLLDRHGAVLAEGELRRLESDAATGEDRWLLIVHPGFAGLVERWMRGLSDGYLAFDDDIARKVDGPVAIRRLDEVPDCTAGELPGPPADGTRESSEHRFLADPDIFDLAKPWFIGRQVLDGTREMLPAGMEYVFEPPQTDELKKTSLNAVHKSLTAARNLVPFAGWEMPVLYTSIQDEHRAVRSACGLFDITHMGTIEVSEEGATRFLDLLTSNFVYKLIPGQSQYTYILRPDGRVMDDLLIYMLGRERFLVVCNASNEDEVLGWLRLAASGEARLSDERPDLRLDALPRVRSLKDPAESGEDMLVDLGLQGPTSLAVLRALAGTDRAAAERVQDLQRSEQIELTLGGFELIVSRTGYTGEEFGYELFIHPDRAPELWTRLMEVGADHGITPAGLGARDSLRAEAGFPLYGHELAGPEDILPAEAGYAAFVKEHKPFFVGREPHLARAHRSKRHVARIRFEHSGIRMFQQGDPVVNMRGEVVGTIASSFQPGDHQMALALVEGAPPRPGQRFGVFHTPRRAGTVACKPVTELTPGDQVPLPEPAVVLERFRPACGDEVCSISATS